MAVSPDVIINELKSGNYKPLYFLQGEESYFIDLIASYIERNALSESEKGFNQVILYGKDVDMGTIFSHAKRFPMMAQRQVVIIKEAKEISDFNKPIGEKLLENYLTNIVPTTVLVFCYKYKTLDARKAITKLIDKNSVLVTSKKLYDNQLPDWVESYIKGKSFSVSQKAKYLLAENVGNNLERLSNEIDKVLINLESGQEVNDDVIEKYVGISKEYNTFELQKALGLKDILKANKIVAYIESNPKSNPIIPIIALLFSFYSKLLMLHSISDKSERGVASALKINPYFAKDYLTAVRNYPLNKVVDNIHYLQQADLRSKGVNAGHMSEGSILRELIFKILH